MTAEELLVNLVFYAVAAAGLAGALAVAVSKNIVRSAFALLMVLFAAAALYALMKADFMFAAQVLIYVGGILVLIIFAIMLTHRITDVRISNESTPGPVALAAVVCVFFAVGAMILNYSAWSEADTSDEGLMRKYREVTEGLAWETRRASFVEKSDGPVPETDGMTQTLGYALMSRYLLPFEVISVLLLAALIGAAFLARKEVKDETYQ